MVRIYLAGPLFCTAELERNIALRTEMASHGYELVLPQDSEDRPDAARMSADRDYRDAVTMSIFRADLDLLDSCDALLINLDGRVPDEGACVELGYAYAKGLECLAIKTDVRSAEYGTDNMMIGGAVKLRVCRDVLEVVDLLRESGLRPRD